MQDESGPPQEAPEIDTSEVQQPHMRARRRRIPAPNCDMLPEAPQATMMASSDMNTATASDTRRLPRVILIVRDTLKTALNPFYLWRQYLHRPSYDPDSSVAIEDLANTRESAYRLESTSTNSTSASSPSLPDPPWPFRNMSIWRLMSWQNSGSLQKSENELNRLVDEVLLQPDFTADDLQGFSAQRETHRADTATAPSTDTTFNGFHNVAVDIKVPSGRKDVPPGTFSVPGLYHRDIISVIKEAFAHPLAAKYHLSPFRLFHKPPLAEKEHRVYGEIYTSEAFIQEHDKVQRAPLPSDDLDCKRERVVAALMFWSDATHLAQFGTAKLWPIYMMIGNLSKYIRAQPNSQACHHLAYVPSVSRPFSLFYVY